MQPNQQNQDQNQSQQSDSLPYQVPGYLQLEPLPDPSVRKSRMKRSGAILLITLLIVVTAGLGYVWLQGGAERDLYDSISRSMQAKYYKRDIVVTYLNDNRVIRANAETDFSDPASPKSALKYTNSITLQQGPGQSPEQFTVQGSQVVVSSQQFTEKIDKVDKVTSGKYGDLDIGKWYNITSTSDRFNTDAKLLKSFINTPLSLIPLGNVNESQKNTLLQQLKDNNVYQIVSSDTDETDGKKFTTYDVVFKPESLEKIYETLPNAPSKDQIKESISTIKVYAHMKIWINKDSQLITKIIASEQNAASARVSTYEVNYEYPDSLNIALPKDATAI